MVRRDREEHTVTLSRTAGVVAATLVLLGSTVASSPAAPSSADSSAPDPTSPAPTQVSIRKLPRLPSDGRLDYQLGGPYAPLDDVAVVDRDRTDPPVPGRFNLCYVNAFQTQPEDAAWWRKKHGELLVQRKGRFVTDPGWPGELLLNTSTKAKRAALMKVVGPWVDGCAADGFDAVEPDNLDSWTRSKKVLTRSDNVAFATLLAQRAHVHGLAVAQKNTPELGSQGRTTVRFDLAVAEECQVYDECDAYTDVYGDQVLEVEYTDNPRAAYAAACRERGAEISVVLRDRDVVPRGRPGYVYEAC